MNEVIFEYYIPTDNLGIFENIIIIRISSSNSL